MVRASNPSNVTSPQQARHAADPVDLSVIIVNYNTRDHLRDCLKSIAGSERDDMRAMEVFVVDNTSTDGSAEVVEREFGWVRLIRSSRNGGFAYANNLALPHTRGRFVLLLNPDTVLPANGLADMVSFMQARPDAGAAGPKMLLPDGRLDLACRRSFPTPRIALYRMVGLSRLLPHSPRFGRYNLTYLDPDLPAEVDSVMGAFMMVRREAIEATGPLDERFFMYGEDLDWAYRMRQRGWRVFYNPAVAVLHHKGAASRQRSYTSLVAFYHAMWLFYQKHYAPQASWVATALVGLGIAGAFALAFAKNLLRTRDAKRVST